MDSVQLRSRLLKLLQKSRKAVRLYSTVDPLAGSGKQLLAADGTLSEVKLKEIQSEEWRVITGQLTKDLSAALENPNVRRLLQDLFTLRDHAYSDWRLVEAELHLAHKDLVDAAEKSDFMKAAALSLKLTRMKARCQAAEAVYHELAEVLSRAKSPVANEALNEAIQSAEVVSLFDEMSVANQMLPNRGAFAIGSSEVSTSSAKVIPLRQKRVLGFG